MHNKSAKLNRREFLYYLGGASIALLVVGAGAGLAQYMNSVPNDRQVGSGSDSHTFEVDLKSIRNSDKSPFAFPASLAWLVSVPDGLMALYGKCVFDGVLVKWVAPNHRFECSACGSKYYFDGDWIEGPANRGLDKLAIYVKYANGNASTPSDGSPISIDDAEKIVLDSQGKIRGELH